eukprot:gi/632970059/ref/XP_007901430.1/ PREDICTED: uncharacterized protein LOC103184966 [Callorhinchus milii]
MFSDVVLTALIDAVVARRGALFGYGGISVPAQARLKAWKEVRDLVNAVESTTWPWEEVRKKTLDVKRSAIAKIAYNAAERRTIAGEPASIKKLTPHEDRMVEIFGREAIMGVCDITHGGELDKPENRQNYDKRGLRSDLASYRWSPSLASPRSTRFAPHTPKTHNINSDRSTVLAAGKVAVTHSRGKHMNELKDIEENDNEWEDLLKEENVGTTKLSLPTLSPRYDSYLKAGRNSHEESEMESDICLKLLAMCGNIELALRNLQTTMQQERADTRKDAQQLCDSINSLHEDLVARINRMADEMRSCPPLYEQRVFSKTSTGSATLGIDIVDDIKSTITTSITAAISDGFASLDRSFHVGFCLLANKSVHMLADESRIPCTSVSVSTQTGQDTTPDTPSTLLPPSQIPTLDPPQL